MAARTAELAVKFTADTRDATKGFDDVSKSAGGFSRGVDKAAKVAAVGGLALVAFGKQAFDAASDAQQAAGAVDAAFGDAAGAIHAFAKDSATSVGLASGDYEALAAVFGASLKNMGVAAEDLAPMTNDLVGLGADLAAQYGGSTSDAVASLSSLLRGETDPIEKYGVSIKAADVAAQKAAMGLDGLTGEADKNATAQATLALLTEQTASAQGAFAREADTAAGAQQIANAQFKDATAALGTALLPVVAAMSSALAKMAGFVKDNSGAFQALAGVIAVAAAGILAIKAGTIAWNAVQMAAKVATVAWTAAQWLINAAMTANPVGLIVVGIAALIAGIVALIMNFDKVKAVAATAWGAILKGVNALKGPIDTVVNAIKSVVDWLSKIKAPTINWPKPPSWVPGFGMVTPPTTPAGLAAAPMVGGRSNLVASSSPTIVVNVSGALDPDSVARQIDRILSGRSRRVGGVRRTAGIL